MVYHFIEDFTQFLTSQKITFVSDDFIISVNFNNTIIRLVPASDFTGVTAVTKNSHSIKENTPLITIYEDQWITRRSVIEGRLLATFGKGGVVFARNCSVRRITTELARDFLNDNHILGYARSRYKYGLFNMKRECGLEPGTLVCVATFSEPRIMDRGGVKVKSYEWVRYAALGSLRVTGGMGKLMNCFINELDSKEPSPQKYFQGESEPKETFPKEIMSYADIDWSSGNSYIKLGFSLLERTKPLEFFVDFLTMKRYTCKQLYTLRQFSNPEELISTGKYYTLRNQGNLKFIRRFFQ